MIIKTTELQNKYIVISYLEKKQALATFLLIVIRNPFNVCI